MVQSVLREYRLHSCDVVLREDVTIDQFIDVVEGNRKYMPCLYVMNKIDQVRKEISYIPIIYCCWFSVCVPTTL